ncbi:MAG: hypothetical protein AAGK98_13660 [Pseudomonadota bacterium]
MADRRQLANALEDFAIQFEDEATRAQIGSEGIGYMAGGGVGVAVSAFGLLAAGATTAFPLVLLGSLACSIATLLGYRRERLRFKTQAGMAKELRDAAEKLISSE